MEVGAVMCLDGHLYNTLTTVGRTHKRSDATQPLTGASKSALTRWIPLENRDSVADVVGWLPLRRGVALPLQGGQLEASNYYNSRGAHSPGLSLICRGRKSFIIIIYLRDVIGPIHWYWFRAFKCDICSPRGCALIAVSRFFSTVSMRNERTCEATTHSDTCLSVWIVYKVKYWLNVIKEILNFINCDNEPIMIRIITNESRTIMQKINDRHAEMLFMFDALN